MVYAIERIVIILSEPRFGRAALVVDPAVGVFDVIALDAEGGGVSVGEGEGAGVGHVVARGIVVGGGQLQAVALLAAIALGTPVSQLPCSCERAAQFHVLPVGVALLAVDGDGLAGLPFAHTRQRAVGLEGETLEVSLRVADVLVVPCADHERPVLLVQLHSLFVCLRVGISWFVAAARGECEGGNQEEEKFCLVHIAYFLFRAAKLRKREEKVCGEDEKVGAEGESLNKCSEFWAIFESFDLILVKSIWISATLSFQLGDKHL